VPLEDLAAVVVADGAKELKSAQADLELMGRVLVNIPVSPRRLPWRQATALDAAWSAEL
jgi:hypothetical protein